MDLPGKSCEATPVLTVKCKFLPLFTLEIRYHQLFTWEIPQNVDVSRSFPNRNLVNDEHSYGTGIKYVYIYTVYIKLFFSSTQIQ